MIKRKVLTVGLVGVLLSGCANNNFLLPHWHENGQSAHMDNSASAKVEQDVSAPQQPDNVESSTPPSNTSDAEISDTQNQNEAEQFLPQYRPDRRDLYAQQQSTKDRGAALWLTPKQLYNPDYTHKQLASYAEQLTMRLMENNTALSKASRVGIASFVELNHDLRQATVLGNQLAEVMITELQDFGVPVVDFKLTGNIDVGNSGDFVFSRKSRELSGSLEIDYLLAGTVIRNQKGATVNARIMSATSHEVIASASLFIPQFVVEQLSPRFVMVQ